MCAYPRSISRLRFCLPFLLLLPASLPALAQEVAAEATQPDATRSLVGKVVTIAGKPLAGATVMVLGDHKNNAAITNQEGQFLLTTRQEKPVLVVSCAGFEESEVDVPPAGQPLIELTPIDRYKKQLRKRGKAAYKEWKKG